MPDLPPDPPSSSSTRRAISALSRFIGNLFTRLSIDVVDGAEKGRIVALFGDLRLPPGAGEELVRAALGRLWLDLVQHIPTLRMRRVFTNEQLKALEQKVTEAKNREGDEYEAPAFERFYYLTGGSNTELATVAKVLGRFPKLVEHVYLELPAPVPKVTPPRNLLSRIRTIAALSQPSHMDAAPVGTGAASAQKLGFDGSGQRAIDLEQGWTFDHEGLLVHGLSGPLVGGNEPIHRAHGTSVLGILCAEDKGPSLPVGIAPRLASIGAVSFDGTDNSRAVAIFAAMLRLNCGDMLVLEAQALVVASGYPMRVLAPIEAYLLDYVLIRLCTALGIVVVEAGGNGYARVAGVDLDAYRDGDGNPIFDRAFRDSKAILVSAATSTHEHRRIPCAPYGSRIDCYAWGDKIRTLDSDARGNTTLITEEFGLTSGATAIIGGVALLVQQWAKTHGSGIDSETMRRILSDPTLGTRPAEGEPHIGSMPNLEAILAASPTILLSPLPCI